MRESATGWPETDSTLLPMRDDPVKGCPTAEPKCSDPAAIDLFFSTLLLNFGAPVT